MSQRKASVNEGEKCGACEECVCEREARVHCELCEKWFHTVCVKISEYTYKVLDKMKNLHWFL